MDNRQVKFRDQIKIAVGEEKNKTVTWMLSSEIGLILVVDLCEGQIIAISYTKCMKSSDFKEEIL